MTDKVTQGAEAEAASAAAAAAADKATVSNVQGSSNIDIDAPVTKTDPNADQTSPDTLGVSQAQFDKFYDKDKRSYNWEGHAKELAWQMSHKGEQAPGGEKPTEAQAAAAVQTAGLDMDALTNELADNGKLSEDSIKALEAVGIPRETAEGYSQFILGEAQKFQNEVKTYLGGDQGLATLKDWALQNLTPAEIKKYEEKLSDPNEWKDYANSLKARAGVRAAGAPVHGQNAQGSGSSTSPYKDMSELLAAQRDPKYRSDPKYRAQVMERARASTFSVNARSHNIGV